MLFFFFLLQSLVYVALLGLFLVAARGGYSPVAVPGLLTAVASLVAKHRL